MEYNNGEKTFIERGIDETNNAIGSAARIVSKPGAVLYERIKPMLLEVLGHYIIRPLMSPRRIRYN